MPYVKTNWIDNVVEFPNRYTITTNSDGTVIITPNQGEVAQAGTPLSSTYLNKIESALAEAFDFSEDNAGTIKNITKNVIGLALEVETIKKSQLSGVDANIFVEQFTNLNDVILISGLHDAQSQKIYLA